jgi:macrolide transport system ATP-binding/permease protein
LPDFAFPNDTQRIALYREVESRLSSLPGVTSVGISSDLPVQCNCNTDWIRVVGKPFHGEHNEVLERDASPNYLQTLGARLIRGRMIGKGDGPNMPHVVVINEAFVQKYFPGEDPIGQKIGDGDLSARSMREVVGVIANVREEQLDSDIWPVEYEAMDQGPDNFISVVVRTSQDEKSILPTLVSTLRSINPSLGVYSEATMNEFIGASQTALIHQFSTWLVGGFAAMALVLGVVGLYGVIAYSVSQRTREIGVRMALGAQRGMVYKMVLRQAGWLTVTGLGIGLGCAVLASKLMDKLLFGVKAWDAPTLIGVGVVLGVAAMAASFVPAHRAASVNPTEALRAE